MFKGGMGNIMKQAQQMQENMQKVQEEIAQQQVVGEAGAGFVKVHMNGRHEVLRIELDEQFLKEEKEFLEDLLAAAVNDAVRKVETQTREKMDTVTAGLNLPAGFKMPF